MSKDIIPSKDSEYNTFQNNVIASATTNAVAWGIPNTVITSITGFQTTWVGAYATYLDPALRTSGITQAKNDARFALTGPLRSLLQQYIQPNPAATPQQRVDMGIKPIDGRRTRSKIPETMPQVDLKNIGGHQVKIFFKQGVDEQGVSRRGKPEGVNRCNIVYKVGDPAPASFADCPVQVDASRSPLLIVFDPEDADKKLYVFARWVNPRNEGGAWTTEPVVVVI